MWYSLLRLIWFSFALLVISTAVLLSAARILLPEMSEYRTQLESVAANYLQRPVHIGALNAAWQGMSPVLRLQQFAIEDEHLPGGRLDIEEVQVVFDILASLRHLQWRTLGIEVIGVSMRVEVGKRPLPPLSALLAPFRWLLQQDSIVLRQLHFDILDSRFGRRPMALELALLKLVNADGRHQLLAEAGMPDSLGGSVKLAADFIGEVDRPDTWQGRSYLETMAVSLDILQPWLASQRMSLAGRADAKLWLDVENGQFHQTSGSLAVHDLAFGRSDEAGLAADLQQLTTGFRLLRRADDWQLALHRFELERNGVPVWPASNATLTMTPGPATSLRGHVSHVALQEVQRVLPLLPWIEGTAQEMLDALNVTGTLDDMDFDLEMVPDRAPRFSARARFDSLGVKSASGLPDIHDLSGSIEGNLQSGFIRFDSAQSVLSMPGVFPRALQLDALTGTLYWQRYREMFRIETEQLELASGALQATARSRLDWPYGQTPWLDLRIALKEFPLEEVRNYLPEKVMRRRAVAWLKKAFTAGTARNARFLFQGRLDQVPFDQGDGRLEARFDFDAADIDYHPAWGRLEESGGSALFVGRSMTITADSGLIMDAPVRHVVAEIRDFKHPLLKIDGTVDGTLSGMLHYVEASPLDKRFGKLLASLHADGDASLRLKLDIPLVPALGKVTVNGDVTLDGNSLHSEYTDLPLDDLHGVLHFTGKGISARKVKASLLGQPVIVSVYQQGKGDASRTVVDARGKLKFVQALRKTTSPFASRVDGAADWLVRLLIRNQPRADEPMVLLRLSSDLVGVSSSLPAPFDKAEQEVRKLQVEWLPGVDQPGSIRYADWASAQVLLSRDWSSLRRVAIRFGDRPAVLPDRDQIRLSGHLEQLDVPAWVSVFARRPVAGQGVVPPLAVDLELDSMQLFGYQVRKVAIVSRSQDPWYFLVKGEGATGWLRWIPGGVVRPGRLMANMDVLVLEDLSQLPDSARSSELHPRDLPELELHAGDLDWSGRRLGEVSVASKGIENGVSFDRIDVNSAAIVFTGSGAWKAHGGQQTSEFRATLSGGDLGKLLGLFGDQGVVKGGDIEEGSVQLNWPGSPVEFSLEQVEGEASVKVVDGRLDTVREGAGKLLHLISLNSLQRRLTLDFTDLFKEGFSFDKLRGHFVIADGNAYTDGFRIKGPSADIEISGRTGLVARDYDQLVIVTPQVSSSLPIAGVIAGGPVVGAAVLLVERLMGQNFNRMVQVRYQVTGTWDNPEYTRLNREIPQPESESGSHPAESW